MADHRLVNTYRLFRDQMAVIDAFDASEGEYLVLLQAEDGIEVRLDDLVVAATNATPSSGRSGRRCRG